METVESKQKKSGIAIVANLLGSLAPIVIQLVTIPLYLKIIGVERYGILSIVWLLLGYFGLFDLGFGSALASRIAMLHEGPKEKREDVFWTGTILSCLTGTVGGIILFCVGRLLFTQVFHVSGELQSEVFDALPFLALTLPFATTISALSGALQGRHAFIKMNLGQSVGMILYQIFPLIIAIVFSTSLSYLIIGALVGRLMTAIMLLVFCIYEVPASACLRITRSEIKPLLTFGGWVTLTGMVSPILTIFDRFVIGAVSTMAAVTAYTVPYNIVSRTSILPAAVQKALFPRFAMENEADVGKLLYSGTNVIAWIMTPIVVFGILAINPFLTLWVGEEMSRSAGSVGQILFIGLWVNGIAFIPYSYLQARGRPDIPAKFHVLELIFYAPLLWFFVKFLGVNGAAIAGTLRVAGDAVLLLWVTKRLQCLVQAKWSMAWIGAGFIWSQVTLHNLPVYFSGSALLLAACGLWAWITMPATAKSVIMRRLKGKPALN